MAQRVGGSGGGGGPNPRGLMGGITSVIVLGTIWTVGSNSLFNVDGGHRAIKYTRVGGVKKEIYSEGMEPAKPCFQAPAATDTFFLDRYPSPDPMVRDTYRL